MRTSYEVLIFCPTLKRKRPRMNVKKNLQLSDNVVFIIKIEKSSK